VDSEGGGSQEDFRCRSLLPAVMAELLFFGEPDQEGNEAALAAQVGVCHLEDRGSGEAGASGQASCFDVGRDYVYQDCLYGAEGRPRADTTSGRCGGADDGSEVGRHHGRQWAYLVFSQPVTALADALVIGSRLDADLNASSCRSVCSGHGIMACRVLDVPSSGFQHALTCRLLAQAGFPRPHLPADRS